MINESIDEAVYELCVGRRGDQTAAAKKMADVSRKNGIYESAESIRCHMSRQGTAVEEPNLAFLRRVEDTREIYSVTEFMVFRNPKVIAYIKKRMAELGHLPEVFGNDEE